jgi:hypothetical protein
MNSHLRVSVLCFWLFFLAFRPILCCCVHISDATVTPPSLARAAHHLLSPERHTPSRHTTFVRLRRHLRQKSRRDKPSRYGSFEKLHFGHTTSLGLRAHHGLRTPLGSGLDPSLPTNNLESSIGQAFQSHLFRRHHSLRNHHLRPPGHTTTSDGEACLAVNPPPTARAVPPPPSVDVNHG